MIRTRDFFLYTLVLLFLCIGISATLVRQWNTGGMQYLIPDSFVSGQTDQSVILQADDDSDKTSVIDSLKKKIASGAGFYESLDSLDTIPVATTSPVEDTQPLSHNQVQVACMGNDNSHLLAEWPLSGLSLEVVEGARLVEATIQSSVATGTSAEVYTLVALPIGQPMAGYSTCSTPIVGVTPLGRPLKNGDAAYYQSAAANSLIGYAFDGLPIYGAVADEASLDVCGGQLTANGYAYHVRSGKPNLVDCFVASPQTVKLP